MGTVDFLLVTDTRVIKRTHTCYAIAKCGCVDLGNIVYMDNLNIPYKVIGLARSVREDAIDLIREKNNVHSVKSIAVIQNIDISMD